MTRVFSLLVLVFLLVACAPAAPSAPVSPVPPAPTATLTPTATPVPTPPAVSQAFKEALPSDNLTAYYQMKNLDRQFAEHFSADEDGRIFLTLADGQQIEVEPQSLETVDLAGENLAYKRLISLQTTDGQALVFFPGYQWSKEVNGQLKKGEVPGQWFEAMTFPELKEMAEAGEPLTDKALAQLIVEGIESGQISLKDLASGRLMASVLSSGVNYEGTLFIGWERYLFVKVDKYDVEHLFLRLGNGQKVEVEVGSLAVNVDNQGKEFDFNPPYDIMAFYGKGEHEGERFAFFPGHEFVTIDEQEKETKRVVSAHWFEVIRFAHLEDPKNQKKSDRELMEEAIKLENQVKVELEQIFNGDWSTSVLLSGWARQLPKEYANLWIVYHNVNDPSINGLTENLRVNKLPLPILGVIEIREKADEDNSRHEEGSEVSQEQIIQLGVIPALVCDPEHPENVHVISIVVGQEMLEQQPNQMPEYLFERYPKFLEKSPVTGYYEPYSSYPILIIRSEGDELEKYGILVYQPSVLKLKEHLLWELKDSAAFITINRDAKYGIEAGLISPNSYSIARVSHKC